VRAAVRFRCFRGAAKNSVLSLGPQVTASSKLVVPRKVVLSPDRFQTFHDFEKDPRNKKNWYLDRKCELLPRNATDAMPSQRKIVRPQSTWAITATVKQRGEEVKLVRSWE